MLALNFLSPRVTQPDASERFAGLLLLILSAPIWAIAALVIVVLSGRSPFVAHRRAGQFGRPFWMLKLRTMWPRDRCGAREWRMVERIVAEPDGDRKNPRDPRVTSRFAAFCRRFSIDELPQLAHVAAGRMSLVGPRPLTFSELERHYGSRALEVLSVKPGISGYWQVCGRSALLFSQRVQMDLELVHSLTPRLYLRILLRTLPVVLKGQGAW